MATTKTTTVIVDGDKQLHLTFGKTLDEWESIYGWDEDKWDFPIEELLDGTISIDEGIWYWYINGRCYETAELV